MKSMAATRADGPDEFPGYEYSALCGLERAGGRPEKADRFGDHRFRCLETRPVPLHAFREEVRLAFAGGKRRRIGPGLYRMVQDEKGCQATRNQLRGHPRFPAPYLVCNRPADRLFLQAGQIRAADEKRHVREKDFCLPLCVPVFREQLRN